jgi:multidrug transporter EmrE-like cation transporter
VCYATAGILAVGYLLAWRHRPRSVEWRLGGAMALGITLATILVLFALETLPGIIVFPARIVFVIVFTAGLSVLLWKESLQAPGVLGLITAAAAISCFGLG